MTGLGILVHSDQGVIDSNSAFRECSGYQPLELLDRSLLDLVAPECRDLVQQKIVAADEEPYVATALRKDGSSIPVEISEKAFTHQGVTTKVAVVRELLKESQSRRLNTDFLDDVVHSLRSPLFNIRMALQMIDLAPAQEQRQQYRNLAINECNRGIELINDLLDLGRIEAGSYELNYAPIDLNLWLLDLLQLFEIQAREQQQRLTVDIPLDFPLLTSDSTILGEILQELLANACKYTVQGGEILLRVRTVGQGVEFTVHNTAQIPETALPQLFDRFYRVPQGDPRNRGGSGLGLAVIKEMVQLLRGEVSVTSQDGWTTFRVWVPSDEMG